MNDPTPRTPAPPPSIATVDLSVRMAGLTLRNPILAASGCFGYGAEFAPIADLQSARGLAGVCTKGLSLKPRPGNPPPRICETAAGMINAIGLENVGVEAFIRDKLPALASYPGAVVANLFGETVEEYAELARRLGAEPRVDALELNISCPNVKKGGIAFGSDPESAAAVTRAARAASQKPLFVKISPNIAYVGRMAKAIEDAGADGLTAINTVLAMSVDIETRRPRIYNTYGGLSGPAIKPIALRIVHECARAVRIPVMAIGGIMTATDALEFILVGAHAVQVGTAAFANPDFTGGILAGMEAWLRSHGHTSLESFRNTLELYP